MDSDTVRGEGVVGKVLGGFDVVLVVVGPVEINLLAVVRDGVAFAFGVAALGDKVAVLIVTAEEGVQLVEDARFESLAAARACGFGFQGQILLTQRRGVVGCGQVPVGIEGVLSQRLADLRGNVLQFPGGLGLVGQRAALQLGGDGLWQVLRDEPLDHVALVIHDAVDAKVQVGAIELEELAQEVLKLLQWVVHQLPFSGFCE